jgi:hypothetical protein
VLSIWFKMCLSFLSVWFRVASGLGQWFIADWLKVGAKFYLKSVQGLIRNLLKIHVSFRFGFGFVFPVRFYAGL